MHLIFVRHGESEANLLHEFSNSGRKHPLTDKGRLQAEMLAKRLRRQGVVRIFSSPVLRALETAQIVADELGLTVSVEEALREYDVGVWEGSTDPAGWAEYARVDAAWLDPANWGQSMTGGESLLDVRERFLPFLEQLKTDYAAESGAILLVSHGGLYRVMLPLALVNCSPAFTRAHPIPPTGMVSAETRTDGSLICTGWWDERGGAGALPRVNF